MRLKLRLAGLERFDHRRIELLAGLLDDLLNGRCPRPRLPVRPIGRHRIERVGDGENAGAPGDLLSLQVVGIAHAVPPLVVGTNDLQPFAVEQRYAAEHLLADDRVCLHHAALGVVVRPGLFEHGVGDRELADVVQPESVVHAGIEEQRRIDRLGELGCVLRHSAAVHSGPEVFRLERNREGETVSS